MILISGDFYKRVAPVVNEIVFQSYAKCLEYMHPWFSLIRLVGVNKEDCAKKKAVFWDSKAMMNAMDF